MANNLPDDPKALACNAYNICFKEQLKLFSNEIDRYVATAGKKLKESLTYAYTGQVIISIH
jgi:hypothetical protein